MNKDRKKIFQEIDEINRLRDEKAPKTIHDVFNMSYEHDDDSMDVKQYVWEAFAEVILHRFQCTECLYNEYLCKDANPSLLEDVEQAFLKGKTVSEMDGEWALEAETKIWGLKNASQENKT